MLDYVYMKRSDSKKADEKILHDLLTGKIGKKFQGKQVIVCAGDVFIVPQKPSDVDELLKRLVKKHPHITPIVTFVPKEATYILVCR